MKRFFSIVMTLALILCAIPTVSAAGSASWSGPSVVRAGDTVELTFFVGGGVLAGSCTVNYDPALLTFQGYKQLVGGSWKVEWKSNVLFYDDSLSSPIQGSSPVFKATFAVNASVAAGTPLSVSATNVTLSDGSQDTAIGTVAYSTTVAQPLSKNCDLASLAVSGAAISPAFSPKTTRYSANVPFSVSSIGVQAAAADAGAKVAVSNPQLTPGGTTQVQITVTAESGDKKIYTIAVTRAQDPNYVPSSDARLKDLAVEGGTLSPAFRQEVTQYYIWLPYETESLALSASAQDPKASCTVGDSTALAAGTRTDIPVTVTAEDGTQQVYTVTVVRAPAHEQTEEYLAGRAPEATTPADPTEPEPTEPEPTVPTQPEQPVPSANQPGWKACLLPAGLGFAAGAGLMLLILLLPRKKK